MNPAATRFDIIICGGSFVGLTLAQALARAAGDGLKIAVVDRMPLEKLRSGAHDGRAAAITASVKTMLETIGVWHTLADQAQPILRIELTDSALETPIRTALIGLDAHDAPHGEPTAFMVENTALRQALTGALDKAQGITWLAPDSVSGFDVREAQVEVRLGSEITLAAPLLVAADGQHSVLREMAGIRTTVWTSDKKGISVTVELEKPHDGLAIQHFLPAGPFAILPLTGNRASIVWTEDAREADRIINGGGTVFLAELEKRSGGQFGKISVLSQPAAYPLTMTLARDFVLPRFALAGDAAHGLHWIAGQGLNHGLKDVAALAEVLMDAVRLGLDLGSLTVLRRYERWRRFDSASSAFSAAALDRIFANDSMALRMLRSAALQAADRITPLKTLFMREAAGLTGTLPKLLQGQQI